MERIFGFASRPPQAVEHGAILRVNRHGHRTGLAGRIVKPVARQAITQAVRAGLQVKPRTAPTELQRPSAGVVLPRQGRRRRVAGWEIVPDAHPVEQRGQVRRIGVRVTGGAGLAREIRRQQLERRRSAQIGYSWSFVVRKALPG
jgi:hypothetical protein